MNWKKIVIKRVVAVIMALSLCFVYVPKDVSVVYAANKNLNGNDVANYCNSRVGGSYTYGYCLSFVADVFQNLGAPRSSACCAKNYSNGRIVSTSMNNIPIGADVFFSGSNIRCDNCGNMCGHIGIYVGDGYVVHVIHGVEKTKLTTLDSYSNLSYIGWGYHGNVSLTNAAPPKPSCGAPAITTSDIKGGKFLAIKGGQADTVNFTILKDGKKYRTNTAKGQYDEELLTPGKYSVSAYSSRAGYNNSAAKKVDFVVSRAATPGVSMSMTDNNVILDIKSSTSGATIYYTTNGSEPNVASSKYSGALSFNSNKTVKAIAVKNGFVNSEVMIYDVKVQEPDSPTGFNFVDEGSVDTNNRIAVGNQIGVKWDAMPMTTDYIVSLYKDSKKLKSTTTKGTTMSFTLDEPGKYEVRLYASNFVGNSEEAYPPIKVEAMNPSKVRFVDYDGKLIKEQEVSYNGSADIPEDPERRGYTFVSWDEINDAEKVTKDVTITATYKIKTYSVKFYDAAGKQVGSTQKINYGSSAVAPEDELTDIPTGYVLAGWKVIESANDSLCDYKNVDSDLKLQAVYYWENDELPVVANITSATRNSATGNYNISVNLTNYPNKATTAILRVSLYTKDGKMVKTGKTEVEIPADKNINENVTLKYSGKASKASVVLLGLKGNDLTGSAYSKQVVKEITEQSDSVWSEWSEWGNTLVEETDEIQVESKKEYRYRDKETTTSTSSSLDGWTKYDSKTSYGAWGNWSGYSATSQTKSEVKDVQTRTTWRYFYYQCPVCGRQEPLTGWSDCGKYQLTSANIHYDWFAHAYQFSGPKSFSYTSKVKYTDTLAGDGKTRCFAAGNLYSMDPGTRDANTGEVIIRTEYSYRTRTKTITNYFYKWGEWSNWSDEEIVASDDREVESRTVYRSRKKVPVYSELAGDEETGKEYEFTGNLMSIDADLKGKLATIMVYKGKNTDPNEDQIQYVGQTNIDENNSYSFKVSPKTEPTDISGDFTVCLGLEGSTGLVMIGKIDAPKPVYNVKYVDDDGSIISEQEVKAGDNALVPESPSKDGYTFVGWNANAMNVQSNMTIGAVFVPLQYSIAYVDGANNVISFENYHYGDKLTPPDSPTAEGRKFKGWDAVLEGKDTVTGNAVVNAVYDIDTYVVNFVDEKGNSINKQLVEYGKSAMPPSGVEVTGKEFMGWSTDEEWWNVSKDMNVEPIFAYADTVDAPVAEFYEAYDDVYVTFDTATDGAEIYYYLSEDKENEEDESNSDSSDAFGESQKYEGIPVKLSSVNLSTDEGEAGENIIRTLSSCVKTYAVHEGMNDSAIQEIEYMATYETPKESFDSFDILFDSNGGSISENESRTVVSGETIGELPLCIREGYVFEGWYTAKENGDVVTKDLVVENAMTLFAHWKKVESEGNEQGTDNNDNNKNDGNNQNPNNGGNNTSTNPPTNDGNNTVTPANPAGQQTTTEEPVVTVKQPAKTSIKSLKNKSKKAITINWKNVKATGYEIQIALNKKFTKGKKLKRSAKTSLTIKSLKKGKTYYVRIRAYNQSGSDIKYSSWSKVKKVKIKK